MHFEFFKSRYPIIPCFKSNHRGDPYHRFEMRILHLSRTKVLRGNGLQDVEVVKLVSLPKSSLDLKVDVNPEKYGM